MFISLLPDPGCEKSPPTIPHGYFNVSGKLSCWGYPEEGSNAEYHCEEGHQLLGTALYVCSQGEWIPEGVLVDDEPKLPICSESISPFLNRRNHLKLISKVKEKAGARNAFESRQIMTI